MNDSPHAADCDAPLERQAACLAIATVVSALGGFLFGYDNLVISGAIDYLTRSYGLDKIDDAVAVGWVSACAVPRTR